MIGLLIVCHCDLGKELLSAVELIVGSLEAAESISITPSTDSEEILKTIAERVKALNRGGGVMILTDMFGGTPCNVSLSFLKKGTVEVLTGVNLPMVIAIAQHRHQLSLEELGAKALEEGKRSIALAGKLLEAQ
jgi:PTS system mannose-specific IIA component